MQASDEPARLLARVTLKGAAEEVTGEECKEVADRHRTLHGEVRYAPRSVLLSRCLQQLLLIVVNHREGSGRRVYEPRHLVAEHSQL